MWEFINRTEDIIYLFHTHEIIKIACKKHKCPLCDEKIPDYIKIQCNLLDKYSWENVTDTFLIWFLLPPEAGWKCIDRRYISQNAHYIAKIKEIKVRNQVLSTFRKYLDR